MRFDLLYEIGKGGFGEVFVAQEGRRKVVVKRCQRSRVCFNEVSIYRYIEEKRGQNASLADRIIQLLDVQEDRSSADVNHGFVYLLLEEAEGWRIADQIHRDLFSYVSHCSNIHNVEVRQWLIQVVDALLFLHGIEVIHRDVKPHNMLLCAGGQLKLCDMGTAVRLDDPGQARSGGGTPNYMAPEIFNSDQLPMKASDLWSLGATLFFLLEKKAPFQAKDIASVQQRVCSCDYELAKTVPAWAKSLIAQLLQPDPGRRLPLSAVKEQLESCLSLDKSKSDAGGGGGVANASGSGLSEQVNGTSSNKPARLSAEGLRTESRVSKTHQYELRSDGWVTLVDKVYNRRLEVSRDGGQVVEVNKDAKKMYTYDSMPRRLFHFYGLLQKFVEHLRAWTIKGRCYTANSYSSLVESGRFRFWLWTGADVTKLGLQPSGRVEITLANGTRSQFSSMNNAIAAGHRDICEQAWKGLTELREDVRIAVERGRPLPVVHGLRSSWMQAPNTTTSMASGSLLH
ncbi:uncharacterized protein LOC135814129 [Sycon ciliatum]|uniref:uncharacterized protein LOC135814129 n=1 Tax=Sycon ciliatum TaxID=27933 RepID=UPI0031F6DAFA